MKKLLLTLLFIPTIHAMELVESSNTISHVPSMELIDISNVSSADSALKLYTNHKDIYVEDENAAYRVEKHNMNALLQEISNRKALSKFKDAGYIRINKNSEGKYALAAKVRGEGGGPILGAICYVGVKTAAYTALMTGIVATNAVVPGAGPMATSIAIGGSVPAYLASTEAVAIKAALWGSLMPWL